jgi:heme exporter protein D
MATVHMPRHHRIHVEHPSESLRQAFWVALLGVIATYAFFVALGAFGPGEVVALTVVVGAMLALWIAHAWAQRRHAFDDERDPRMRHARERRGF